MAKLTQINPAMFDPDSLEQIFAKGVTARDNTAGLASSWLLMQGDSRLQDQQRYLGAQNRANEMDAALQRQEIAAKLREQGMKSATDLIKEGFLPSTLNAGGDLFNDQGQGDNFARDLQTFLRSKTFANMNKGAGGGTKESVTVQQAAPGYDNADGTPARGPVVITAKGANPASAQANAEAAFQSWGKVARNPNASPAQKAEAIRQMNTIANPRNIQPD
jgi:hypothetical protein